jgi:hypothetical protein
VDIGRGGCSATVELILTFRARASSDLIISRQLAGKARVLSSHEALLNHHLHDGLSFTHAYHHHDDPADTCPTLLGPLL